MMLEEILHKYCALGGDAFTEDGDLTEAGSKAYRRLIHLLYDLGEICGQKVVNDIVELLDRVAASRGI